MIFGNPYLEMDKVMLHGTAFSINLQQNNASDKRWCLSPNTCTTWKLLQKRVGTFMNCHRIRIICLLRLGNNVVQKAVQCYTPLLSSPQLCDVTIIHIGVHKKIQCLLFFKAWFSNDRNAIQKYSEMLDKTLMWDYETGKA